MSIKCDLTGHTWQNGNKVSHSNRKTKRKFLPNLRSLTLYSEVLQQKFKFKVSNKTMRTVDFKGGLDEFLLKTKNRKLTIIALNLKKKVMGKATALQGSHAISA